MINPQSINIIGIYEKAQSVEAQSQSALAGFDGTFSVIGG